MTERSELPRVQHLRKMHATALQAVGRKQNLPPWVNEMPHGAFDRALAMDPSRKAIYLQTIIRWLLSGAVRFEDEARVKHVLARFDADKHRLPIEHRDIGRHETPGDIADLIDPDSHVVVRDVPSHVLDECEIVATGKDWALFRVDWENAAAWWANGTDWCTRHHDTCSSYLSRGPLYVVVSNGKKYQYHWRENQFMDKRDRNVRDLGIFSTELLRAILDTAQIERMDRARAFLECSSTEARVAEELRRRGGDAPRRGVGWISRDGTRSVVVGDTHQCANAPTTMRYRGLVAHYDGISMPITRETFMAAETVPDVLLDLLRSDHPEMRGTSWTNRALDDMAEDVLQMWTIQHHVSSRAIDFALRGVLFEGWANVGGHPHLVWTWDEAYELSTNDPPRICVLDLDGRRMHVIRTRSDALSSPRSVRRAITIIGRHSVATSGRFGKHYGLDVLKGGMHALRPNAKRMLHQLLGRSEAFR